MRFDIKRKVDGKVQVICDCAPTYHATYLQVPYLEVQSLAFDTLVKIKIGDYIDWRDGIRYKVYRLPNITQNTANPTGNQFEYDVMFYHPCKQLEIALWKDLVYDDNRIHYSSQKSISTYEALDGIKRRIQACLDYQYPDAWNVTIADGLADVVADITEPKEYSLEAGQTVLDALNLIYDTWENVGWTYESGVKNTIVIGGANVKTGANTIPNYAIGKGKGMTRIKATLSNSGDICTRLYPFGSSRNLPARYYNSKNILNAESVDIQNLMIPTDYWGKTGELPDASKAYIDNTDAIEQFGVIPKVLYFDDEEYGDVYPTIEGLTIGDVRYLNRLSGIYYPSPNIYTDASERVDLVLDGGVETDDGIASNGKLNGYAVFTLSDSIDITHSTQNENIKLGTVSMTIRPNLAYKFGTVNGSKVLGLKPPGRVIDSDGNDRQLPTGMLSFSKVTADGNVDSFTIPVSFVWSDEDKVYNCLTYDTAKVFEGITSETHAVFNVSLVFSAQVITVNGKKVWKATINGFNGGSVSKNISKYSTIHLKQIGFNIADYSTSATKPGYISMKTGACAGRTFLIKAVNYQDYSTSPDDDRRIMDSWRLEIQRVYDKDLKQYFPNSVSPIAAEDQYVLTDILLPDVYIGAAEQRLLKRAGDVLAELSKPIFVIEPSLDSIFIDSHEALLLFKTGVYFDFDTTVFVDDYYSRLIDTVTVSEKDAAIPIVTITLREKKRKSFKAKTYNSESTSSTTDSMSDTTNESITSGTGSSTVDAALDSDSSNPVQNKVVKAAIDKKADTSTLANYIKNSNLAQAIEGAQINISAFTNDEGYITQHQSLEDYAKKSDLPSIPTKVSAFENDKGYLTSHQPLLDYVKRSELTTVIDELDIPTKTSDLTNDSGFITSHQDLSDYAKKSELPTKTSQLTNDSGFLTQHQSLSGYATTAALANKQDKLVSGTNIKTINGKSLIGRGNITIEGGGSDSGITKLTQSEYNTLANNGTIVETKLYVVTTYDAGVPAGYRKINGTVTSVGNGGGISPKDKQRDLHFAIQMTAEALLAYRQRESIPFFDWLGIDYNDVVENGWSFFGNGTDALSVEFEDEIVNYGIEIDFTYSTGTTIVRSYYGMTEYGRIVDFANETNAILPDAPAGVTIMNYGNAYAQSQDDVIFMDGGTVIANGTGFNVAETGAEQEAKMYLGTKRL